MTTDELRAENMKRFAELEARGFQLDPLILLKERLDLVTSHLFIDVEKMMELEEDWEERIAQILDMAPPPEPEHPTKLVDLFGEQPTIDQALADG